MSATLILSRKDGAVVRASGLVSSSVAESAQNTTTTNASPDTALPTTDRDLVPDGPNGESKKTGTREAEEVARLVWNFFKHAGDAAEGIFGAGVEGDGEDEVRLVRLRTRRKEVVVVPDAKFLLCVIHDTPPA